MSAKHVEMDRRPSSYRSRPSSSKPSGPSCVICFKMQSIYSIGTCDHPVCYECSTTMRVLCDQKECPICRRILTKVIFTKDEVDLFKNLDDRSYPRYNKKYGIAFGDLSVENSFDQLLRCYCKKCYERPEFTTFEQLATHMERNHRLYACRLCVNNLKIFPSQRRWYNYDELTRHEECGDPDNTSHRGHPECQFCNVRYLDKDELYKHLRKEHFYCHFCDADGIQDYYMTYDWLRKHYFDKHYLCEEGSCINEKFTSVFRTAIDLQAHRAQTHSRDLGKQGYKEARTLKLEFTLRPRHNPAVEAGRPNQYQPPRPRQPPSDYSHNNNNHSVGQELATSSSASDRAINVRNTSDFPSLNGQHTTVLPCARTRKQNQSVNTRDLHSFPALGQDPQPPVAPKAQKPAMNSIRMAAVLKKPAEPPKPDRNKDAKAPSGPRLPNQARDFPSLDGNQNQQPQQQQPNLQHPRLAANKETTAASGSGGGSWVSKAKTGNESDKKKVKKEPAAIKKKIAEAPKVPGPSDFPNLNKKYEPSKSNLAKLGGNKKKSENSKKIMPGENNVNGSGSGTVQSGKKNLATVDHNGANKENCNKSNTKTVDAVQMSNGEVLCKTATTTSTNNKAVTSKPEVIKPVSATPAELPKKEPSKKKESAAVGRPSAQPDEESVSDANNPKEKKKRKKNENRGEQQQPTSTSHQQQENHHQQQLPNNYIKTLTPKIPPGFENAYQQQQQQPQVRAPPGLSGSRGPSPAAQNHLRIKAPPGLSLTDSGGDGGKPFEYLHPAGSSVRNKVLINNLMASLIPARDERFDTFEKFKEMSTLFRKHVITAFDFYSYCVEALAPHSFDAVFQELVLLLPDIQKQRELLFIYNRNSRHEMDVEVCKHCRQVLRASDLESHQSVHSSTARS
ncbi:E3 ubiquitin-protein ligase ZNF598 isoform X1 [Myzus persicae]|uniref:E3 ubiquitin-protein ligase ZNF598 isoform X1 n=1 Tax=Myzus persicae TaxID=13164 RepID=UPI000B9366C9|nr:E3 ubiquitin-protein ligase ZNF598 isoform X1 [Myzus persicae]